MSYIKGKIVNKKKIGFLFHQYIIYILFPNGEIVDGDSLLEVSVPEKWYEYVKNNIDVLVPVTIQNNGYNYNQDMKIKLLINK